MSESLGIELLQKHLELDKIVTCSLWKSEVSWRKVLLEKVAQGFGYTVQVDVELEAGPCDQCLGQS